MKHATLKRCLLVPLLTVAAILVEPRLRASAV